MRQVIKGNYISCLRRIGNQELEGAGMIRLLFSTAARYRETTAFKNIC